MKGREGEKRQTFSLESFMSRDKMHDAAFLFAFHTENQELHVSACSVDCVSGDDPCRTRDPDMHTRKCSRCVSGDDLPR